MPRARLVAVSQRVDCVAGRGERRDALDQAMTRWLDAAGLLAVPVPNALAADRLEAWLEAVVPIAIVLSGGNDIGKAGERDATETALLRHAEGRRLPLLGICRGLQMLVHHVGGVLTQADGHVGTRHGLVTDSAQAAIKLPDSVNSFHRWTVAACPPALRVLARCATDGSIEAVAHATLPWEGWAWHPERETTPSPVERERLLALVAA